MDFILSFIFFMFFFITYSVDKNLMSPIVLTPILWSVFLVLFNVVPHSLYSLQSQFQTAIFLWVISFVIGGFVVRFLLKKVSNTTIKVPNRKVLNVYFLVVLVFVPITVFLLVTQAINLYGIEYFFVILRSLNTGSEKTDASFAVLGYIFNFSYVVLLLQVLYYDSSKKFEKTKMFFLVFLNVLLSLITVSRSSFVFLFFAIFAIFFFKGKIKKKHYFLGLSLLILIMLSVTFLRSIGSSELGDDTSFSETISIYLFGGMPAFDTIKHYESTIFGENTFRFFYALFNSLGFNYVVQPTILEYANVPIMTNVYTMMYSFFKDFGMIGVAFFGLINGFVFQFFYLLSLKNNKIAQLIYAHLFPMLLMQFFGEYLFSNFSTFLQFFIFCSIPFFLNLNYED